MRVILRASFLRSFNFAIGQLNERNQERAGINCICFSRASEFLACSSSKGTVHVFSVLPKRSSSGSRSGARSTMSSVTVSEMGSGSASAESTVIEDASKVGGDNADGGRRGASNATSNFALLRKIIPGVPKYVESEWSFAQVHGLEPQTICAFGQAPNSIIIVGAAGSYLMSSFAEPGECERLSFARFVRSETSDARRSESSASLVRGGNATANGSANAAPPPSHSPALSPVPPSAEWHTETEDSMRQSEQLSDQTFSNAHRNRKHPAVGPTERRGLR